MIARLVPLLLLFGLLLGCGGEAEVGPETYKYVTALHSICNRKDEPRLQTFVEKLEAAHEEGTVNDVEYERIREIVALAKDGDWKEAAKQSRAVMEGQVKR